MSTATRLPTTNAAPWETAAACKEVGRDTFFEDASDTQQQAQGVCRGCPVKASCLRDILRYEDTRDGRWGVVGGLTPIQRRALHVESLLGNRPNLRQARVLALPSWAGFMHGVRDLPADLVAAELRKLRVIATPVTVRVALWWVGGSGTTLRPKQVGDRRFLWHRVRDECEDVVRRVRALGVGNRDLAAYLGVSEDALRRAVHAWNARTEQAVAA